MPEASPVPEPRLRHAVQSLHIVKNVPARLWIIPAKEAPVALVVRRKPHDVWHFLHWDTMRGTVTSGDWLWDLFYPKGCDVSWDGRLWAYHSDFSEQGSGVAPIATLDSLATWYSHGAWDGGGFFESPTLLRYSVPSLGNLAPAICQVERHKYPSCARVRFSVDRLTRRLFR